MLLFHLFSFSFYTLHCDGTYRCFGSKTRTLKNACWPLSLNPLTREYQLLLRCSCLQFDNRMPLSTSLHIIDNILLVKSHTSLCLIVIKPPFLQLIACFISILGPHAHIEGIFINFHPYLTRIPS